MINTMSRTRALRFHVAAAVAVTAVICCPGCGEDTLPEVDAFHQYETALQQGDTQAAMQHLDESITAKPTFFAFRYRAQLHLEMGNTQAAIDDCNRGLELDPENSDLKWLLEETKKPAATRLKSDPPSFSK